MITNNKAEDERALRLERINHLRNIAVQLQFDKQPQETNQAGTAPIAVALGDTKKTDQPTLKPLKEILLQQPVIRPVVKPLIKTNASALQTPAKPLKEAINSSKQPDMPSMSKFQPVFGGNMLSENIKNSEIKLKEATPETEINDPLKDMPKTTNRTTKEIMADVQKIAYHGEGNGWKVDKGKEKEFDTLMYEYNLAKANEDKANNYKDYGSGWWSLLDRYELGFEDYVNDTALRISKDSAQPMNEVAEMIIDQGQGKNDAKADADSDENSQPVHTYESLSNESDENLNKIHEDTVKRYADDLRRTGRFSEDEIKSMDTLKLKILKDVLVEMNIMEMQDLNLIITANGKKKISKDTFNRIKRDYDDFKDYLKAQSIDEDATYGLMGIADKWKSPTGQVLRNGGAEQYVTPLTVEILIGLGIIPKY